MDYCKNTGFTKVISTEIARNRLKESQPATFPKKVDMSKKKKKIRIKYL